jgi:hypothetical protein
VFGRGKFAPPYTIGTHKLGVAKAANGCGAVFFAATPQVAARKAAKHRCAARLGTLALEGVEKFFDGVGHGGLKKCGFKIGYWIGFFQQ